MQKETTPEEIDKAFEEFIKHIFNNHMDDSSLVITEKECYMIPKSHGVEDDE